ncbi:MAG: oligosaccharide repeat unit polymerase [Bacteroidales bacterium]
METKPANSKLNIQVILNPFFVYCISFLVAIILYLFSWSDLYPPISLSLVIFLGVSFILFLSAGYFTGNLKTSKHNIRESELFIVDILFIIIIALAVADIVGTGYLPILNRQYDYKVFGVSVLDPLFNTLSIYFSLVFLNTFLSKKKIRFVLYCILLLIVQVLILRRGTIVWMLTSWIFLILLYVRRIPIKVIIAGILVIPIVSLLFGLYGNFRSNINEEMTLDGLGASSEFKDLNISHYHYMTYLYISSPLANLQKNIESGKNELDKKDFKSFLFYCIIPQSITARIKNIIKIREPDPELITPSLIVGSVYMLAFNTMGWLGVSILMVVILIYLLLGMTVTEKIKYNSNETYALLLNTTFLLIFDNLFVRLDVLLMLFVYPLLFNHLFKVITLKRNKAG